MTKLTRGQKNKRVVRAKVKGTSNRRETVLAASKLVSARVAIDFRRVVRD